LHKSGKDLSDKKQKAPHQRPPFGDPYLFPDMTFPGNSDEEFFAGKDL